ncbi:peptidoglycan-binding protein [Streptomyces sp. NPDC096105]|uniref:peptidoglycan-binding protein n=1 Tax=Streptomyces sp. NPDC096105 TaxID=3366074 RepID=UPI0038302107
MPTRAQIVTKARSLIGIGENPPGSNRNKITEKYGYVGAWCAMTTWYVYQSFGVDLKKEFTPFWAATTQGVHAAQNRGLWRTDIRTARPGDLVYYKLPDGDEGFVNHTGIVVSAAPSGTVVAIEGNTANVCAQRTRSSHIVGYIDMSPFVSDPAGPRPAPAAPPFPGRHMFRIGKTSVHVTALDKQLIRLGYTKSHDGDGYQAGPKFTKWTRTNVKEFQRAQGWTGDDADGYPGPETWRRLFTTPTPKR